MPNLDTHAGLALHAFPERSIEFAAGEVFDDAVRMAGGLPSRTAPDSLFSQGVRSNNTATDAAFDDQPALIATHRAMEADLAEVADMSTGVLRVSSGPGSDILFSGVSLQRAFSAVAYLDVCDFLLSPQGQERIRENTQADGRRGRSVEEICATVGVIAGHGLRSEYSDPGFVVKRLRQRVAHLPRLAIPDHDTLNKALTGVFAVQQARLVLAADDIYAGTVATLTGEPVNTVRLRTDSPLFPIVPHVATLVERASEPVTPRRIQDWQNILVREQAHSPRGTKAFEQRFAASRAAAHFLLQNIAHYNGEVTLTDPLMKAPAFPLPWTGSISHSQDWAAAAITNQEYYRSIGIDLECRFTGTNGRERVLTPHERNLDDLAAISTRTLFSIKEAIFKAVHPLVREVHPAKFYYHDAEITRVNPATREADIRLASTERGRQIQAILGNAAIGCYFLEKPAYSSAVCVVR